MLHLVGRKAQRTTDAFANLVAVLPATFVGDAQRRQAEARCRYAGNVTRVRSIGLAAVLDQPRVRIYVIPEKLEARSLHFFDKCFFARSKPVLCWIAPK